MVLLNERNLPLLIFGQILLRDSTLWLCFCFKNRKRFWIPLSENEKDRRRNFSCILV